MAVAVRDNQISDKEFHAYRTIFIVLFVIPVLFNFFLFFIFGKTLFTYHLQTMNTPINYSIQIVRLSQLCLPLLIAYLINKKWGGTHFWYRFISVHISVSTILFFTSIIGIVSSHIFFPSLLPPLSHISWRYIIYLAIQMVIFSIIISIFMRIASGATKDTHQTS